MPKESILQILMRRDSMSQQDAEELIEQAKDELQELLIEGDLLAAEDICGNYFGIEPDYLIELLD